MIMGRIGSKTISNSKVISRSNSTKSSSFKSVLRRNRGKIGMKNLIKKYTRPYYRSNSLKSFVSNGRGYKIKHNYINKTLDNLCSYNNISRDELKEYHIGKKIDYWRIVLKRYKVNIIQVFVLKL